MTLRFTCPQGHVLNAKEEFAGKTIRCPTCKSLMKVGAPTGSSETPASQTAKNDGLHPAPSKIVVTCPSGHQLKIKPKLTGKQVRCPKCKQAFTVAGTSSPAAPAGTKATPLSADAGGPIGGADGLGDIPTFDDSPDLGDVPAFADGQDFDSLPAFEADLLAPPGAPADPLAAGVGTSDAHHTLPGHSPAAASKLGSSRSAKQKQATADSAPSAGLPWGALAAGVAFGLVLLAGEGLLLFGLGSDDTATMAEATNPVSSTAPAPQPRVASSAPEAEREVQPETETLDPKPELRGEELRQEEQLSAAMAADSERGEKNLRGEQSSPLPTTILAEVKSDENPYILGGTRGAKEFPTKTWSIAYDEPTGRIALTLDSADGKSGAVAVYEMDKLLDGSGEPVATFETPGLPTSVAIKPWQGKRLYAVACSRSQQVWLYDVDSLEPAGQLSAGGPEVIDIQDLGSSRDPQDPFLYFAALQSYERHGSTYKNNVVGRLDLSTMKLDSKTEPPQPGKNIAQPDGRVAVSADGSTLFGNGASYHYEKLPGDGRRGKLTLLHKIDRSYGALPTPGPFGVQTLCSSKLCSRDLFVTDNTGTLLLASGKQNAILLGIQKLNAKRAIDPQGRINIISANNYKVHASAEFSNGIFGRSSSSGDSRARYHTRLWGFLDETRKLAMVATNSSLIIWRKLLQDVPQEPWLTVTADFPDMFQVGKEISIPLQTPAGGDADVTFELIDKSPYYIEKKKESVFYLQVMHNDSLTFAPFATYSIPSDITLRAPFDIFVMLQTPDGQWTRQYTTKEVTFRDLNDDGKVDRTDDESNPDRMVVAIEKVTANNDMTLTYEPISEEIRPTLKPYSGGIGRVYQHLRARPIRVAVCVAQKDDPSEMTPITKVATMHIIVTNNRSTVIGDPLSPPSASKPTPEETRNRVRDDDFRSKTKFVSTQDGSIAIDGNTLTWTPSAQQIGKLSLGIRARSGDLVKDTYFGVNVALGGSNDAEELPFYVNGISFQRDSDLAVIWGNDSDMKVSWEHNRKSSNPPPGIKYFVGVYDWRQGKVLRHQEIPLEIEFAGISPSGICATVSNPPRLVRFDHQALKPIKQVPLKAQALRIVVVADKYVATTAYGKGERFDLPSLKPIQPDISATSTWLAEDFGDGWMWEGVHWDKPMREAKLLAMPIAFGVGPERDARGHLRGFDRAARMESSGPVLLTLHKSQTNLEGLPLPIHPSRLSVKQENAAVIGEVYYGYDQKIRKVIVPSTQAANPNVHGRSRLFVAHGQEHSATIVDGKIRLIPYSLWELPELGFNFKPVQSTFLLNPSRPTDIQYSAPGAVKYRLRVMSRYTHGDIATRSLSGNAKVLFDGESTDGSFKIAFESIEPLVEAARSIAGIKDNSYLNRNLTPAQLEERRAGALVAYRKRVTDTYRSLTGRAPRKTPVPVYAYVSAENAAGEQAALFHAYLVDVDANKPAPR